MEEVKRTKHIAIKTTFSYTPDFSHRGFLTGGNKSDISFASELTNNVQGCYALEDKGDDSDRKKLHYAIFL
ncbi:MAG: hypothetical protein P857_4 [Candidatus Xenolissoclinum pacificiensis L6]|uniref:Uncharacterized protein n=1 Tax=Candidatus Xenolissoclinum pacificiensis L6 TaxID=1401685 RepID=W2V1M3_9RICK|nr:MAG: hypothetical protein P857_4 [Candidatus Xenolissoclinum pacificiensis L6]